MQKPEAKKFILKLLLFLSPFIIALAVELFVLPIDYFTFRSAEALTVHTNLAKIFLPGSFYPNVYMQSQEIGEMGAHTKYAVKKPTIYQMDQLGYRKQPSAASAAGGISSPIVILGDSYTAGLGLTQADTLSEQLQRSINTDVYPVGFSGMNYYLSGEYPEKKAPKAVILEAIEETALGIPLMDDPGFTTRVKRKLESIRFIPLVEKFQPLAVLLDRFLKFPMYHKLQAQIQYYFTPKKVIVYNTPKPGQPSPASDPNFPEMFQIGPTANLAKPETDIDSFVANLTAVNKIFKQRGIQFIFLPIPQKESIYWQYLPGQVKPTLMPELITKLKAAGIETVDIQTLFSNEFDKNHTQLYQLDDEHWNATGVKITVQALDKIIVKK